MEKLLISACMLGAATRYDGKSKCVLAPEISERLMQKYQLIPFCPEIYGGLSTPRIPSERIGDRVMAADGRDVTENYMRGAEEALRMCHIFGIRLALLKARSPACGKGEIYDGSFSGTLVPGNGVAAQLLCENGIAIYSEAEAEQLLLL